MVKTVILDDQQMVLEQLYEGGMRSKGKANKREQEEAATRTGLPVQVVKDWIGNKAKKESGRKYRYAKASYSRGFTAYNVFVREKKDEFQSIQDWAGAWNGLTMEEKASYKEKAKNCQSDITDRGRAAKATLKKIYKEMSKLHNIDVDVVLVGVDRNDGQQILLGNGKSAAFFHTNPDIMQQLYAFQSFAPENKPLKSENLKELRKKTREHMNDLYAKATGKPGQFPYKKVMSGQLTVTGLPFPVRNISTYGQENLQELLSVEEISVERQAPIDEDIDGLDDMQVGDEQEVDISALDPSAVEALQELLLPDFTHAITKPAAKHTTTKPTATNITRKPTATHTTTKPIATHTTTKPTATHTTTKPTATYTTTKPAATHTITKPTDTHTTTKPTATHTTTKPIVTYTTTKPTASHTHTTKPTATHTKTKPTATHTTTKPTATHTTTKPTATHTPPPNPQPHTPPPNPQPHTPPSNPLPHTPPTLTPWAVRDLLHAEHTLGRR